MRELSEARKEEILDLGWEVMKEHRAPRIYLWLADEGWQGGFEFAAERVDERNVGVNMRAWNTMVLPGALSWN